MSSVAPLVVNGESIGALTQLPRNARCDFFKHMPQDGGGKHVKVKKRRRQDIVRTDFRVHRDPLDHLSVKTPFSAKIAILYQIAVVEPKFRKILVPKT